jgi:trehalose 6-phosphate phosphatase
LDSIISESLTCAPSSGLPFPYQSKSLEHLLHAWPLVLAQLQKARHILLLTDYDGTLTSIVERPELAIIPKQVHTVLQRLVFQKGVTLGIISGRALRDLKEMVHIEGAIYAGNHGFEIEGPGLNFINPLADEIRPVLRLVMQVLSGAFETLKGVLIEDKGLTLSVHYRQADKACTRDIKNILENIIKAPFTSGKVKITKGKKVFEVRPAVNWNKGNVVQLLMKRFGGGEGKGRVLPVYLGDDLTDEDAFSYIDRHGEGISVLVGLPNRDTSARYFLESPAEVTQFLESIMEYAQRGYKCKP